MRRLTRRSELREHLASARADGRRIALVPTMGALHAGHLALVELAAEHADAVVVSIFVNPTQFDRADDLQAYPRDLEGDEAALAGLGDRAPEVVFAPTVEEIYPHEPVTTVHVAGLTDGLCGARRPGHFDGVATVVTKLFNLVQPDLAVFGRKDAQQLRVIRRLVADLDVPVEIMSAPTVREADGLALSSRNRRLSPQERACALAIPASLRAAVLARAAEPGATVASVEAAARAVLDGEPGLELEYLEAVDPDTLDAPKAEATSLLVAVAAYVGAVRLIDNVELGDPRDEERLLGATAAL